MDRDGFNSALDEDTGEDMRNERMASAPTIVDEDPTVPRGEPTPQSFTRGLNTRASLAWLIATHGEHGVKQVREALPRHVVEALGGPTLKPSAMSWVPFMAQAHFLNAIARVHYGGDVDALVALGRAAAFHDLPGIARHVARVMSPGVFVDVATKLWNIYHSHGRWDLVRGERDLTAVLLDRPEHHVAFCAAMRGWIEGALMFAGATEAACVEQRCAAKGAPCCAIRVDWKEKRDGARSRSPRPPS